MNKYQLAVLAFQEVEAAIGLSNQDVDKEMLLLCSELKAFACDGYDSIFAMAMLRYLLAYRHVALPVAVDTTALLSHLYITLDRIDVADDFIPKVLEIAAIDPRSENFSQRIMLEKLTYV